MMLRKTKRGKVMDEKQRGGKERKQRKAGESKEEREKAEITVVVGGWDDGAGGGVEADGCGSRG